ncbi:MAG: glycosyltransferase [Lachnospiraceae bacterium]|nr:glycosyltransferase [Lachnospiraceae bacterium]
MVSVIVPVYNSKETLKRCFDSILNQRDCQIELIIVDDGSYDGSSLLIDEYSARHSCIKVIHQPNLGVGAARNAGLSLATGEFLCFVDSDDFIYPTFCKVLCEQIGYNDIAIAGREKYAGMRFISNNTAPHTIYCNGLTAIKYLLEGKYNTRSVCGRLIRKDLLSSISFVEGHVFEEVRYSVDMFSRSDKVVIVDQMLYSYRMREGSIMTSNENRQVLDLALMCRYVFDVLTQACLLPECRDEFTSWLFLAIARNMKLFADQDISVDLYKEAARILYSVYEENQGQTYKEYGEVSNDRR